MTENTPSPKEKRAPRPHKQHREGKHRYVKTPSPRGGTKNDTGRTDGRTDKTLIRELTKELENGLTVKMACEVVGISRGTYYRWIAEAKLADQAGHEGTVAQNFRDTVRVSVARARKRAIMSIQIAGQKDWRALAWYLERTDREEFGQSVALEGTGGLPLSMEPTPADMASKEKQGRYLKALKGYVEMREKAISRGMTVPNDDEL